MSWKSMNPHYKNHRTNKGHFEIETPFLSFLMIETMSCLRFEIVVHRLTIILTDEDA